VPLKFQKQMSIGMAYFILVKCSMASRLCLVKQIFILYYLAVNCTVYLPILTSIINKVMQMPVLICYDLFAFWWRWVDYSWGCKCI